jgi:hypothetical protein
VHSVNVTNQYVGTESITEFRIDIGIYIDFKFISRGMDFEICRVTELSSKRWFLYCPLPVLQIIVFTCKLQ